MLTETTEARSAVAAVKIRSSISKITQVSNRVDSSIEFWYSTRVYKRPNRYNRKVYGFYCEIG